MKLRFLFPILFLLPLSLHSLGLEEIWDYLDESERTLYKTTTKNPLFSISRLWDEEKKPKTFHRETIAYRLHSFCHRYYSSLLGESPSHYRPQIESMIWEFYLPQVRNLQYNQPRFQCMPTPLESKKKTLIDFRLALNEGFYPFEWKLMKDNQIVEVRTAIHNKRGIHDKKILYNSHPKNCPRYGEEDTNGSGKSDRFYHYNNCNLSKVEEDYNEDGVIERICNYQGEEKLLNCVGVGEESLRMARELQESSPLRSIELYKKSISEFEKAFGSNPRHVCNPYLQVVKMQFDQSRYDEVAIYNSLIEQNPFCRGERLEAQVYDAFTDLYKLKRYKEAARKYETANATYREEYGWHSVEMNLALSLAYLQSGNSKACVRSLERIENRRLTEDTIYLLYYYKGSCLLEGSEYKQAFEYLKKAQAYSSNSEERAQVSLKLGVLLSYIEGKERESNEYFQEAIDLNPVHKNFVDEFKKFKTLVAE